MCSTHTHINNSLKHIANGIDQRDCESNRQQQICEAQQVSSRKSVRCFMKINQASEIESIENSPMFLL